VKEYQIREEVTESKWKQRADFEKAETHRLKEVESHGRREIENQLRKGKESWQRKEEQFHTSLLQSDSQIIELSNKTKVLNQELIDHETMLRGRDTEIQRLGGRLAALEAFPPLDVTAK
jgi:hypothetical protein